MTVIRSSGAQKNDGKLMKTTLLHTPASRLRFGAARADITPPVGINHRFWGAAVHDESTGVHRPLLADVHVFDPVCGGAEHRLVRVQCDSLGYPRDLFNSLQSAVADAAGVSPGNVSITHSHTHSAGAVDTGRRTQPGGHLIELYLQTLQSKLTAACREAVQAVEPVTIEYRATRCDMGNDRDCRDDEHDFYVCGFNPDVMDSIPLLVARVSNHRGQTLRIFVQYSCHPTTLAWENTEISPDYPGALRETVEHHAGVPCTFLLGPCGELGPRVGYVGDQQIADRNGRQVAFAALAAFEGMGPPGHDLKYAGPVVSGANLGTWKYAPCTADRMARLENYAFEAASTALPVRERPDADALRREAEDWEQRITRAKAEADDDQVRIGRAMQERANRWIARLSDFPSGDTYPLEYTVLIAGDAVWVTVEGEPYFPIQKELQQRFPDQFVIVSPVDRSYQVAYLLPRDKYGIGLYQEEPSLLGPGCLEMLIDAVGGRIAAMLNS